MENYRNGFHQMMTATIALHEAICTGHTALERERSSLVFAKMVVRCANWARLAGYIDKVEFCELDPANEILQQYNRLIKLLA